MSAEWIWSDEDVAAMREALVLATTMAGHTMPNPSVGCVLVKDGVIVGRGVTQAGGRPHAEAMALADAGAEAIGAHAYVTLEPCAHESTRGPSCAGLLEEFGIHSVTAALMDPDPRTAGRGFERLRGAGVIVRHGLLRAEAEAGLAGFLHRVTTGRPLVEASESAEGFDGEFDLGFRETYEQALDRMGAAGLMRVRVRPGGPLALQLASRGLLSNPEAG